MEAARWSVRACNLVALAAAIVWQVPVAHAAELELGKCDIVLVGPIAPGDEQKFRRAATEQLRKGCDALKLYLYSPGGDLKAALNIGRQVRVLQLTTIGPELYLQRVKDTPLPRDDPRQCPRLPGESVRYDRELKVFERYVEALKQSWTNKLPSPTNASKLWTYNPKTGEGDTRCVCASACFFIWAAGSERQGDAIQIHRPYFDPAAFGQLDLSQARVAYQKLVDSARAFLLSVDIPDALVSRMFSIGSTQIAYLTPGELSGLKSAPYLEEVKIAKCGPEPDRNAEPPASFTGPFGGPYQNLSLKARYYLIQLATRQKCWLDAQPQMRRQSNEEFLSER